MCRTSSGFRQNDLTTSLKIKEMRILYTNIQMFNSALSLTTAFLNIEN